MRSTVKQEVERFASACALSTGEQVHVHSAQGREERKYLAVECAHFGAYAVENGTHL